jgi:hypothetical protein
MGKGTKLYLVLYITFLSFSHDSWIPGWRFRRNLEAGSKVHIERLRFWNIEVFKKKKRKEERKSKALYYLNFD